MNKKILIIGGAGYIGSHVSYLFAKAGFGIIIVDKFLHEQKFAPSWAKIIKADFGQEEILEEIFNSNNIDTVIHLAALIEVGESVRDPKRFYENNVSKTINLLNFMLSRNVKKLIFSSTCAIYGNPIRIPIDENHPKNPINPYGKTKLAIEHILEDYSAAYDLKYVSLRYFNAAGALPEIGLGEQHKPETHVIPLMIEAILNKTPFKVFGNNHNTKDGTCIRDFIHIMDIAQAHLCALKHLNQTGTSDAFNLGSGMGFSILELVEAIERICEAKLILNFVPPRDGDAQILIASNEKAGTILHWKPTFSSLDFILKSALKFAQIKESFFEEKTQKTFQFN